MLASYRKQEWERAKKLAEECVGTELGGISLQPFYKLYAERIKNYSAAPPGADWQGVYTAVTKSA